MTPSAAAAAAPRRRRRRRNASASKGSGGASARALAAGLWRLRHAQRMKKAPSQKELVKNKRRCQCRNHHHHHHRQIDEAFVEVELPCSMAYGSSAIEKATKWDNHHRDHLSRSRSTPTAPLMMVLMEAELEKARCHIGELEDERRVVTKRLERFLRKLADDKAAWKARVRDKARHAVSALRDELAAERAHRRQLEQANAKLLRELAEARSSARRQAESREAERRARELMEEACSELTREVEEDQAEVELLRRECLRMREEMEEERRMLQMAEVWREERVQMKLCDARIALEAKYEQLNHLQAEMEAFLLRSNKDSSAPPLLRSSRGHHGDDVSCSRQQNDDDEDEVDAADSVLEKFRRRRRKESSNRANSPASSNSNPGPDSNLSSPATDLFLAKIDSNAAGGSSADDMDYDGGRDSCSWLGTSDRSAASVANGNGGTTRSSGKQNTALIRRLWRSAITESRKKTGGSGWSPSWDRRRSSVTVEAEHGQGSRATQQQQQQLSLREKLMEARMDDHKPVHAATRHRT